MKAMREEARKLSDELHYGGSLTTALDKVREGMVEIVSPTEEVATLLRDINIPQEVVMGIRQEVIGDEILTENIRGKVVLTTDELSVKNIRGSISGDRMVLGKSITDSYRARSLIADKFTGDVEVSGGLERVYLSTIAEYSPYLLYLQGIYAKTGSVLQNIATQLGLMGTLGDEVRSAVNEIKGMRGDWSSPHSVYVKPTEPLTLPEPVNKISIVFNNPVVRSDQDLKDIIRETKKSITKSSWSRRGHY